MFILYWTILDEYLLIDSDKGVNYNWNQFIRPNLQEKSVEMKLQTEVNYKNENFNFSILLPFPLISSPCFCIIIFIEIF